MSDRRLGTTAHYAPMVVVLVLAAGLRWMNTGLERLENDGAVHTLKAIAVARHGKLEPTSTSGGTTDRSPFTSMRCRY